MPAVQALYALFEGDDGNPAAVMDGTALTYRKTAADSALGSQLLEPRRMRGVLLMVGAGGLAPYLARAHLAIRPSLARVMVWNRTSSAPRRSRRVAGGGVDAAVSADLEAAVGQADILSCSTASTEPLVAGAWLKAGAHLDLVGGFTPAMRECDDDAVRRARLFVDETSINLEPAAT